jgi:hypothetical protein
MLMYAQAPAPTPEWRDQLALWSDVLGVLGFVISVGGLLVGLWINKQVKQAREEAKISIQLAENLRSRSEHGLLTQCLHMAREAARGKSWQRLLGHLDSAHDWATKLVNRDRIEKTEEAEYARLVEWIDTLRPILQTRKTESNLSQERLDLLDQMIMLSTTLEVKQQRSVTKDST